MKVHVQLSLIMSISMMFILVIKVYFLKASVTALKMAVSVFFFFYL